LPTANIAFLMSGAVLGGALMQFPLGRLSDRMDRRRVLIGVAVAAAFVALVIVLVQPRSAPWVIGLAVAFGAVSYPLYALAVAHANDFAAPDEFVKIAGGLLLLLGCGTMVGPIFAAQAMERIAPEGLFAFTACVHLLLALYTLYRMSKRAAPARQSREVFQGLPVPKTATTEAITLDPRAPAENGTGPIDPQ
jgi:MFS family permease